MFKDGILIENEVIKGKTSAKSPQNIVFDHPELLFDGRNDLQLLIKFMKHRQKVKQNCPERGNVDICFCVI